MEDKLLDYLDGRLSADEIQNLENQMVNDEALRTRMEELRTIDITLKELKVEQPSWNFTDRVMAALDQSTLDKRVSIKNGLLLLSGILIVIGIASLLVSTGVFDGSQTVINLGDLKFSREYIKVPAFTIQGKLMINVIIFLNVALALIVLDRVILKPFFKRRMEM